MSCPTCIWDWLCPTLCLPFTRGLAQNQNLVSYRITVLSKLSWLRKKGESSSFSPNPMLFVPLKETESGPRFWDFTWDVKILLFLCRKCIRYTGLVYKPACHYQVGNLFCYFPKELQPGTRKAKMSTLGWPLNQTLTFVRRQEAIECTRPPSPQMVLTQLSVWILPRNQILHNHPRTWSFYNHENQFLQRTDIRKVG